MAGACRKLYRFFLRAADSRRAFVPSIRLTCVFTDDYRGVGLFTRRVFRCHVYQNVSVADRLDAAAAAASGPAYGGDVRTGLGRAVFSAGGAGDCGIPEQHEVQKRAARRRRKVFLRDEAARRDAGKPATAANARAPATDAAAQDHRAARAYGALHLLRLSDPVLLSDHLIL